MAQNRGRLFPKRPSTLRKIKKISPITFNTDQTTALIHSQLQVTLNHNKSQIAYLHINNICRTSFNTRMSHKSILVGMRVSLSITSRQPINLQ